MATENPEFLHLYKFILDIAVWKMSEISTIPIKQMALKSRLKPRKTHEYFLDNEYWS